MLRLLITGNFFDGETSNLKNISIYENKQTTENKFEMGKRIKPEYRKCSKRLSKNYATWTAYARLAYVYLYEGGILGSPVAYASLPYGQCQF